MFRDLTIPQASCRPAQGQVISIRCVTAVISTRNQISIAPTTPDREATMTASCQRDRTVPYARPLTWRPSRSIAPGSLACAVMALLLLVIAAVPVQAQKAAPDQQRARARMEGAVHEMMGGDKRMKKMADQQQLDLVEFVT